jgi:hypothetical protein
MGLKRDVMMCKWFSFVNLGHACGHLGLGCEKIGNLFLMLKPGLNF